MIRKLDLFLVLTVCVISLLCIESISDAAQSTIVVAEGYSCMGVDKSRKQTEQDAKTDVKRNAVENAKTYIKSQTQVKDFQTESDLIEAYSNGTVTIIEELKSGSGWYKDPTLGDCFRIKAKAEVIPNEKAMAAMSKNTAMSDDAAGPLNVKVWTEKKEYHKGEYVRVYLKGNRPFYARVLYRDVKGKLLQILPNPYRNENYFHGGIVYEIPSGNDQFQLEVSPPFGDEQIILYASTAPLGEIDLEESGAVYGVKTRSKDIGMKTRGIKLVTGGTKNQPAGAEYREIKIELKTKK
ncbi:MAG: DUF4384 domain-containing protein [Syntrophaceae bacterium]